MFVSNVVMTILIQVCVPHKIKTQRAKIYQEFTISQGLYICHVMFKIFLRGRYCYCHSHFTDEETEAQRLNPFIFKVT